MDIFKPIRLRRIEKTREKKARRIEEEQKKLEKKHEEEEYKKELERLKEKAPTYVLTISAPAYASGVGKKLTEYNFRIISVKSSYNESVKEGCLERMTRQGEKINAEIIVDVRPSEDECRSYLIGTALIPKEK